MGAAKGGTAVGIAVSGFVHSLDQITGLLEFNREKVRCRDVDSLQFNASRIRPAGSYFIRPKRQAAGVSLSVQEVVIVLADIVLWVINRIRRWLSCIINNRYCRN